MDKKDFLLQQVIKAYLEGLAPIGSTQLKMMCNINFSPATIRGYFKKLGDEGYLVQEHISSGRIPSREALKEYWQNQLNFKVRSLNENMLANVAPQFNIAAIIRENNNEKLQMIYNIQNNFLLLDFVNFRITIKYNNSLERFLYDLIGLEAYEIVKIAKQVGAYELAEAILKHLQAFGTRIVNLKMLLKILNGYHIDDSVLQSFLDGVRLDFLDEGIYFESLLPQDYLGVCHRCVINDKEAKVLIIGSLPTNFINFYNNLGGFYER